MPSIPHHDPATLPQALSPHIHPGIFSRRVHNDGSLGSGELAALVLTPVLFIGFLGLWLYCVYRKSGFPNTCCRRRKKKHGRRCQSCDLDTMEEGKQKRSRCGRRHRHKHGHRCGQGRKGRCQRTSHLHVRSTAREWKQGQEKTPHRYTRMVGGENWVWPWPPRQRHGYEDSRRPEREHGRGENDDYTYWDGCRWWRHFAESSIRYSPHLQHHAKVCPVRFDVLDDGLDEQLFQDDVFQYQNREDVTPLPSPKSPPSWECRDDEHRSKAEGEEDPKEAGSEIAVEKAPDAEGAEMEPLSSAAKGHQKELQPKTKGRSVSSAAARSRNLHGSKLSQGESPESEKSNVRLSEERAPASTPSGEVAAAEEGQSPASPPVGGLDTIAKPKPDGQTP